MMTACYAQHSPSPASRVYLRSKGAWDSLITVDPAHAPPAEGRGHTSYYTLRDICTSDHDDLFASPIRSGIISSVLRSAPIEDYDTFDLAVPDAVSKEVAASVTEYRPVRCDYRCIFGTPEQRSLPLAPGLDPCPDVAIGIHQALSHCRTILDSRLLFPRCSRKTVGREVERNFWERCPDSFIVEATDEADESGGVTTLLLQRLQFWHGITTPGPVEVRSSWKYSVLKPRVYFAQGGDTFDLSKYIQPISNILVDSLEVVHRKNRYYPLTEELRDEDTVAIYDYSSFTSTLDEIHGFLAALADFMSGVSVLLVGDMEGPKHHDLGDLIRSFSRTCNFYAEFDSMHPHVVFSLLTYR